MATANTPDLYPHLLSNDGEGLEPADLNDMIDLARVRQDLGSSEGGAEFARGSQLNHDGNDFDGMDHAALGARFSSTGFAYVPSPWQGLGFYKPSLDNVDDLFLQQFTVIQNSGAAITNKRAEQNGLVKYHLDDEDFDLRAILNAAPAPGGGDPRWDTLAIKLGWEAPTGSEVRDFKDGVTGALSTAAANKRQGYKCEIEIFEGTQQTAFLNPRLALPGLEWAPLLSIKRLPGETPFGALDPSIFFLHTWPTRLRTEDVMGYEFHFTGAEGSSWNEDVLGLGALEKNGAGGGTVFVFPRTMNEAHRLVGISLINTAADTDFLVQVGRFQYGTDGFPAFVPMAELSSSNGSGPINGSEGGYKGGGPGDWDPVFPAAGVPGVFASRSMPIWGNGQCWGPMFSDHRQNYVGGGSEFSKLCIRIQDASGEDWGAGDRLHMMRFHFLE